MSWFSRAISNVGNFAKKAASTVAGIALPLASSLVGAIPVFGGMASKITDSLGNKLISGLDGTSDEASASVSVLNYVDAAAANNSNFTISRAEVDFTPPAANSFLGIGGSAPGLFGIGDGKPGVFGVGTGKSRARKAAEAAARAAGGSPSEVAAAGDRAASRVAETGSADSQSSFGLVAAAAAAALLLLL